MSRIYPQIFGFVLLSAPCVLHAQSGAYVGYRLPAWATLSYGALAALAIVAVTLAWFRARRTSRTEAVSARPLIFTLGALGILASLVRFFSLPSPEEQAMRSGSARAELGVATIVGRLPESERVAQLEIYLQDPNPGLRFAAANALQDQTGPAAADALERAYLDNSSTVRECTLQGLKRIDRARGLKALIQGLKDRDSFLRETAALQLSSAIRMKQREEDLPLVPFLMASVDDKNEEVALTAMHTLRKLTGVNIRVSRIAPEPQRKQTMAKWRAWWKAQSNGWPRKAEWDKLGPRHPERLDEAPPYRMQDLDGTEHSQKTQRGRVTLLSFWGTWNGACRNQIQPLIDLDRDFRAAGLDILGLTLSESNGPDGVRTFCRTAGISYPQAVCTRRIQDDYGSITEIPVSVLIDKQGRIRRRWEGPRDFDTFAIAVRELLAE